LNRDSLQIELIDPQSLLTAPQLAELQQLCDKVLAQLPNAGELRVRIVDDQRMAIDHQQYSGIAGTTDVLTFDLAPESESFDSKILDTDLTTCFDEAARQSSAHNHTVVYELLLYIIHGTLHCLGFDDHDDTQYQRMHKQEDTLLTNAGIGPLFYSKTDPSSDDQTTTDQASNKETNS
tara:strand:+ start:106380 stop:106913 length:534 start_codon:yes stop_codon:yes gene_type:complete